MCKRAGGKKLIESFSYSAPRDEITTNAWRASEIERSERSLGLSAACWKQFAPPRPARAVGSGIIIRAAIQPGILSESAFIARFNANL